MPNSEGVSIIVTIIVICAFCALCVFAIYASGEIFQFSIHHTKDFLYTVSAFAVFAYFFYWVFKKRK